MSSAPTDMTVEDGGLRLRHHDGRLSSVAALWLMDQAMEACHPVSGQRTHGVLDLDPSLSVLEAAILADTVRVRFSSGAVRHVRLSDLCADLAVPTRVLWPPSPAIECAQPLEAAAYLADDQCLQAALAQVAQLGLVRLQGAETTPDALETIIGRFGYIRETNYGRLFTVRAKAEPENLAFTDQALELHTDNPYRDPTPTLQALHVIEADAAGGGESLFVDGFAQAKALRTNDRAAFDLLAGQPVDFVYTEASGAQWTAGAPIIELDAGGEVRAIRVNHRSMRPPRLPATRTQAWYAAYISFVRALHDPRAAYARRLAAGDVVIFDNRRVLHGRRVVLGQPGSRWLQGCYADIDSLLATLARLDAAPQRQHAH